MTDNFGLESVGGDGVESITNVIRGTVFTCANNGTAQSMTAALRPSYPSFPFDFRFAIYKQSDLSLVGVTELGHEESAVDGGFNWYTLDFPTPKPILEADTAYILAVWGSQTLSESCILDLAYDDSSGEDSAYETYLYAENSYVYPDPFGIEAAEYKDYSIYCTYITSITPPPETEYGVVANAALPIIAGLMLTDIGSTAFDYVGIGIDDTAPATSQTNLSSPVLRKAGIGTVETSDFVGDTAQVVAAFSSADGLSGTQDICETAVFNAGSGGTMLFRCVFTAKTVDWDGGDTLTVTNKLVSKLVSTP